MKKQVRGNDSFRQRISASEVDHRTERRCSGQATPQHDFLAGESGATDGSSGAPAAADRFRNRYLDWIAGDNVQSVKPSSSATGESRARRQPPGDRGETQLRA